MRLREVNLGYRRYSLVGPRKLPELYAVSGVRQAQLAHQLPEDARRLSGAATRGRTCRGRRWPRLPRRITY